MHIMFRNYKKFRRSHYVEALKLWKCRSGKRGWILGACQVLLVRWITFGAWSMYPKNIRGVFVLVWMPFLVTFVLGHGEIRGLPGSYFNKINRRYWYSPITCDLFALQGFCRKRISDDSKGVSTFYPLSSHHKTPTWTWGFPFTSPLACPPCCPSNYSFFCRNEVFEQTPRSKIRTLPSLFTASILNKAGKVKVRRNSKKKKSSLLMALDILSTLRSFWN